MAKRLTEKQIKEISKSFAECQNIVALSERYQCSKLTIVRNLKKFLGELKYLELLNKGKSLTQNEVNKETNIDFKTNLELPKNTKNNYSEKLQLKEDINKFASTSASPFLEIVPLDYDIDASPRKDCASVPISDIEFPKIVYMIVDKKIELEVKLLKDYPEWAFLSESDLKRKSIEIHHDLQIAKRICNKDQKVIKVPNTNVFKIVAPILASRGISRIVSTDKLIAL